MDRSIRYGALLALTVLSACGGGADDGTAGAVGNGAVAGDASAGNGAARIVVATVPSTGAPGVRVDDPMAGSFRISTGGLEQPTVGRYLIGRDGSRLLALEQADESVGLLLNRAADSLQWVAVPPPEADLDVAVHESHRRPSVTLQLDRLVGRYVLRLADGSAADFGIDADGNLLAGSESACALTGRLTASPLAGALALVLESQGCEGLPARAEGVVLADPDDAPAALRLLAQEGSEIVDLRGYSEPAG